MHRRQAEQIGFDRFNIVIFEQRVGSVRERRIEMLPLFVFAFMYGAQEVGVTPVTDSGLFIRRDIWRIECTHRRFEGQTTRKRLAVFGSVTSHAVGGLSEVFAAFNQVST